MHVWESMMDINSCAVVFTCSSAPQVHVSGLQGVSGAAERKGSGFTFSEATRVDLRPSWLDPNTDSLPHLRRKDIFISMFIECYRLRHLSEQHRIHSFIMDWLYLRGGARKVWLLHLNEGSLSCMVTSRPRGRWSEALWSVRSIFHGSGCAPECFTETQLMYPHRGMLITKSK